MGVRIFTALISICTFLPATDALAGPCDAYFPFENSLADASGNGYDGRMIGPDGTDAKPEFVPGKIGTALHFTGKSAMRALLDLHFDRCPQVTFTAWIRIVSNERTGTQYMVSTGGGSGPGLQFNGQYLKLEGTGNGLSYRDALRDRNEWYFVAGAYDYTAGKYTLYFRDRPVEGTLSENLYKPEDALWVGGFNDKLSYPVQDGYIDDLRIIGRTLDAAEIDKIRQAATTGGVVPMDTAEGQACNAPGECPAGTYCAFDRTCHPERHLPLQTIEIPTVNAPVRPLETGAVAGATAGSVIQSESASSPEGLPDPRPDPATAGLTMPDDLPDPGIDEAQQLAQEKYEEDLKKQYQQSFGPRNRAQVALGSNWQAAYASTPTRYVSGPGHVADGLDPLDKSMQQWLNSGRKIREVVWIKGSDTIVAIADDGSYKMGQYRIWDSTDPNYVKAGRKLINRLWVLKSDGLPVDVVDARGDDFIVISGTEVFSDGAPQAAVDWIKSELDAGVQVTAIAMMNGDAWIAVSDRAIGKGGMNRAHWGWNLVADLEALRNAGERIEDISNGAGSVSDVWMIATDKRVELFGYQSCRSHATFGSNVDSLLPREWACEFANKNCLADFPSWSEQDMGSGTDENTWLVNLLVTVGVRDYEGEDKQDLDCYLADNLRIAERVFGSNPALKFRVKTRHLTYLDGANLYEVWFSDSSQYRQYMDDHFDVMAKSKTEGYYQMLISENICVGYNDDGSRDCDIGGISGFPHVVRPFKRKHGIIMEYPDSRGWVMAHEIGHYLGLIHTFSTDGGGAGECNEPYDPDGLDNSRCASCRGTLNAAGTRCNGTYNVMDYCGGDDDDAVLNSCQIARAAKQRERYMTNDGATNYFDMKGRLGEAYCASDSDCLDDEYCNEGVFTLGRNVCKDKLNNGAICVRSGQCESGRCSAGFCSN
jgi:hypothetical protein